MRLAAALGGERAGAATLAPITFGIERPVQPLRLARPLAVGPLAVTELAVRTRDYGNAEGVGEDERTDPDEVVITAKGKRDRRRDELWLGADALARCSTIVFDKARKQVRLTCG